MTRRWPSIVYDAHAHGAAPAVRAQDPFEIQVYEYQTVPRGRWDLETHVSYAG